MQKRMEIAVAGTLLLLAVVFALFIDAFVAKPKTLFGRSLSAIEPTAFPLITMAMMIVLCGLFFYAMFRRSGQAQMVVDDGLNQQTNWIRIGAFFLVLVLYALTFDPLGFPDIDLHRNGASVAAGRQPQHHPDRRLLGDPAACVLSSGDPGPAGLAA